MQFPYEIKSIVVFYISFWFRLPFDWKTPLGYSAAGFLQFAAGSATFLIAIPNVSFFCSSCWLFIFVADDITNDLMAFNRVKAKKENLVPKLKRFCEIIQIHSDAKQYATRKPFQLIWKLARMCIYSFFLQACSWFQSNLRVFTVCIFCMGSCQRLLYASDHWISIS